MAFASADRRRRPMTTPNRPNNGMEAFADEVFRGDGAVARRLRLQVARIAPHFRVTLLTGERCVGKRSVARELHRLSPVAECLFVAMRIAEVAEGERIPDGCGTIYMEGLEALSGGLQANLVRRLKALERRTRVVLASEADLRGMLAAGRMRQDLYEMVGMPEIRVAPLRERMGDFDQLAGAMLRRCGEGASFAPSAIAAMRAYGWPGNLAELWQVCGQVGMPGAVVEAQDLPRLGDSNGTGAVLLDDVIERHVKDILQRCAGNKLKAAELLGISRSTLYRMLETA